MEHVFAAARTFVRTGLAVTITAHAQIGITARYGVPSWAAGVIVMVVLLAFLGMYVYEVKRGR